MLYFSSGGGWRQYYYLVGLLLTGVISVYHKELVKRAKKIKAGWLGISEDIEPRYGISKPYQ